MEVEPDEMIKLEMLDGFDDEEETKLDTISNLDNMKYLNNLVTEAKQISIKALEVSKLLFTSGDPLCADIDLESLQSALLSATESLTLSVTLLLSTLPQSSPIVKTDSAEISEDNQLKVKVCEVRLEKVDFLQEKSQKEPPEVADHVKEEKGNISDEDDYLDDPDFIPDFAHDIERNEKIKPVSPVQDCEEASQGREVIAETVSEADLKKCTKCKYKTNKEEYLSDHLQGGMKFQKCPFCDTHIPVISRYFQKLENKENFNDQLKEHVASYHPQLLSSSGVRCLHCDDKFIKIFQLFNHLEKSHNLNLHPHCPHCDFSSSSVASMMSHIKQKHGPAIKTMKKLKVKKVRRPIPDEESICSYCGKLFAKKIHLMHHIKNKHSLVKLQCEDCDFVTCSNLKFYRHRRKFHTGAATRACGQCDLRFKTIKELNEHVYPAHGGHKHRCDQCTYSTYMPVKLRDHILQKHSKEVLSCDKCDFKTTLDKGLQRHMQIHEKAFKCEEPGCHYTGSRKADLKKHHERDHDGIRYTCDQCPATYRQRETLYNHIKRQHKNELSFPCPDCDFVSKYKKKFRNHYESVHQGIKYPCQDCEYTASTRYKLQYHRSKHHSATGKFACSLCNYTTHSSTHLKSHLERSHKVTKDEETVDDEL
eukprot:TRINITY_DN6104_c0_g1_i12.p1 TRINITY_DN6104_c0_g1~~TRINITY_DN6104_c0_g1_i12.p1  ORF type:complete len:648 (-),score=105.81 TRINITY_DN6104_c0_g1_i12:118-2061(-)